MSFIPKSVWLHETRILSGSMYSLIHGLNLHVQFLLYPLLTSICVAINFFRRLPRPRELNQKSLPVILAEVRKIYSTLIQELPSLTKIYLSFEFTFVPSSFIWGRMYILEEVSITIDRLSVEHKIGYNLLDEG